MRAQKTAHKRLEVKSSHVMKTELFAQLQNLMDGKGNVYLRSSDLNRLTSEALREVLISSSIGAGYVNTGDEVSLKTMLSHALVNSQPLFIHDVRSQIWGSVFWDPLFSRPDRLFSYLNQTFQTVAGTNESLIAVNIPKYEEMVNHAKESGRCGIRDVRDGFMDGTSKQITQYALNDWLRHNGFHFEWTGEKIKLKPVHLERMNTHDISDKDTVAASYVQIVNTEHPYSVKMTTKLPPTATPRRDSSSPAKFTNVNQRLDSVETDCELNQKRLASYAYQMQNYDREFRRKLEELKRSLRATFAPPPTPVPVTAPPPRARHLKCPQGFISLPGSRLCLWNTMEQKNWTSARDHCRRRGFFLPSIGSFPDQILFELVCRRGVNTDGYVAECWHGLSDLGRQKGDIQWVDGSPLYYTNWMNGQLGSEGHCVNSMWDSGKWYVDSCTHSHYVICGTAKRSS